MIQKIEFRPGIVREKTEYANAGGWFTADKVRFRAGYPEKIGGWQAVSREQFKGTCRSLHQWSSVEFDRYVGLGTNEKLYILWGNSYYDITPLRKTISPLPAGPPGPICTYIVPNYLKVHAPAHGMTSAGDWVKISGATTVDTFAAAVLNTEYQVISVVDPDNFTIQPPGTMTAVGICGGGAAVSVAFQIPVGLDNAVVGTGWGIPPWGGGNNVMPGPPPPDPNTKWTGWGMSFDPRLLNPVGFDVNQIRLWDMDNFGEDLVSNIRHGPIYYWHQASGVGNPSLPLNQAVTVAGVTFTPNQVPSFAAQVLVSPNDRHLIALGCDDVGAIEPDPLLVRWSTEEDAYDWEPRRDNSAGGQRLSLGSYIISGLRTRQEILIWTDLGLWSMKYIGIPYVFGFDVIAEGLSIMGPNASVNAGNMLFWMDRGIFYSYTGQVQELPCAVKDFIFSDLNYTQEYKICAGHNHSFSEVIWFYPSADSDEINRYVLYNYVDQTWSIGQMQRTCWLDMGRSAYPIAASRDFHILYYHELGDDADGSVLPAYIESSDLDQGGGDHFLFLSRMIPDVQFRGTSSAQTVGISILKRNVALGNKDVAARFTVSPIGEQAHIRVRGRQLSIRVESNNLGVGWRLGTLRGDLQVDGKR
jgi:hypothetical protein